MEITITARHMPMSEEMKQRLFEKFEHVGDDYVKCESLQIVIEPDGKKYVVEAHMRGKMLVLEAKGHGETELNAADDAVAKLVRQLHKFLEKKHEEPHRVKSHKDSREVSFEE